MPGPLLRASTVQVAFETKALVLEAPIGELKYDNKISVTICLDQVVLILDLSALAGSESKPQPLSLGHIRASFGKIDIAAIHSTEVATPAFDEFALDRQNEHA